LESVGVVVDRRFKYRHQSNSYPVIKEILLQGKGACVGPEHVFEREIESGELFTFENKKFPALLNRLYVSSREGSLNTIHQQFWDWLLKVASKK
jgi:DNA-binding transcriptional LysR family regulator